MQKKNHKQWKKKIDKMLSEARVASAKVCQLTPTQKKQVLLDVACELKKKQRVVETENRKDLAQARKDGLSAAMIDRLTLDQKRIAAMAEGVQVVARMKEPIGQVLDYWRRPNGLKISKVAVPIGVILIIYESRPNVTVECASLCLKSGNAVVLRGGREAFFSNKVLVSIFKTVLKRHRLSSSIVSFVETTDRQAVDYLLQQDKHLNLVIPRGGQALIRKVAGNSRIPVIKHYQGICHVYIDKKANQKKAIQIAYNAKMQRPGVCNAMETLLVHQKIAAKILPELGQKLNLGGCEVRADRQAKRYLPMAKVAKNKDYGFEYLDKILAIKVVADVSEAIEHIRQYGSGHTESIVTQDKKAARQFQSGVDSSSVMVNASTRFADGFEYGFGAEIGISTDKIHARGPMGLQGLTSYKYLVEGTGQIRV